MPSVARQGSQSKKIKPDVLFLKLSIEIVEMMRSSVVFLLFSHLSSEVESAEGVDAHESNIFRGRREYSYCDAGDVRGWDVAVLKGIELPGLMLPI